MLCKLPSLTLQFLSFFLSLVGISSLISIVSLFKRLFFVLAGSQNGEMGTRPILCVELDLYLCTMGDCWGCGVVHAK